MTVAVIELLLHVDGSIRENTLSLLLLILSGAGWPILNFASFAKFRVGIWPEPIIAKRWSVQWRDLAL
jgi:hypothetical protein